MYNIYAILNILYILYIIITWERYKFLREWEIKGKSAQTNFLKSEPLRIYLKALRCFSFGRFFKSYRKKLHGIWHFSDRHQQSKISTQFRDLRSKQAVFLCSAMVKWFRTIPRLRTWYKIKKLTSCVACEHHKNNRYRSVRFSH